MNQKERNELIFLLTIMEHYSEKLPRARIEKNSDKTKTLIIDLDDGWIEFPPSSNDEFDFMNLSKEYTFPRLMTLLKNRDEM